MKQVFMGGPEGVLVEDVPAPCASPGEVLVRVAHSLISTGTEGAGVRSGQADAVKSPLRRVIENPALVSKAVRKVARDGASATIRAIRREGDSTPDLAALGYSAAGTVMAVGSGVTRFSVGDTVACAGAGFANHAEYISVPENLTVRVPKGLDTAEAAFVTLGAIAMQGIRRARVGLGDRVGIVGLGLLGQIGSQIACAAGCRVLGIDLDRARVELAVSNGAERGVTPDSEDPVAAAMKMSDGVGLDAVIIYAGTKSSSLANQAFEMARERANVVVVGDVGMDLERPVFYNREQDFLISRSYGPGRYDPSYELDGLDYPIAYVRWTENRNMEDFLRLAASRAIKLDTLIAAEYPVEKAPEAYSFALGANGPKIATLLTYPGAEDADRISRSRRFENVSVAGTSRDVVRIGLIGAGSFAQSVHVPNIAKIPNAVLRAIADRDGPTATTVAKRVGASLATTDYREILADPEIDAVIIATRHDAHAQLSIEAAKSGKHVFVEKPLALTAEDCAAVAKAVADAGVLLTVGFNRRYSPHVQLAKRLLADRVGPKMMVYRANAGFIPLKHWVYDPVEGGGRIVGEACHFIDLLTYIAGAEITSVYAVPLMHAGAEYSPDNNLAMTIAFADGSVGQIMYACNGTSDYPKERVEITCDKTAIGIDDYRSTVVAGFGEAKGLHTKEIDKGHLECLQEFVNAVAGKGRLGMGVVDGVRGTVVALEATASARDGQAKVIDLVQYL
jgi:predicted dehydrogenase/threonine dehydrogenase-like Zn-dependent dehydrogenase